MKTFKPYFIIIVWCFIISALLPSCAPEPGIYINDQIPSGMAGTAKELNTTLLKALQKNNLKLLETILSNELMQRYGINGDLELCSTYMREGKNTMLGQVYSSQTKRKLFVAKMPGKGINGYSLSYTPLSKECYIAMYTLNYRNNKWLLTAIYNKYKYGWKLSEMEVTAYTVSGKTAPEIYHEAKAGYDKGYLVGAINLMERSRRCAIPSSIWRYNEMAEMDAFYSKTLKEGNSRFDFPVVVKQVSSHPQIISMSNTDAGYGISPLVSYVSKFDLKDTKAIDAEHQELQKVIGDVLPGINKMDKRVYFTIYNKSPFATKEKVPFVVKESNY
ncbi:hypothetical protein [Mucilaginibacter terrae]|uniref:Uncharacterized protein n=1 Tax=Mucilaginibacter terrae TaxID=1955052 RepID=A0ABU3GU08_9SPHI|nr:hypothetical protein [Mucilaginibacter terrae]MDT3402936.1 hypothetical protein [Mucilaginibacter terrae]